MEIITAEDIFLGRRYNKLKEYAHKLSEGRSRNELRTELRKTLNATVRVKVKEIGRKDLSSALHRCVSLLQMFLFKSIFSEEQDIEKMTVGFTERCLVEHILGPNAKGQAELLSIEGLCIVAFQDLALSNPTVANQLIADNFHDVVLIMQEIINEL